MHPTHRRQDGILEKKNMRNKTKTMQQIILRNLIFLRPCLPDGVESRNMKHWFWCYFKFVSSSKWSSCLNTSILKLFRIIVITWIRHSFYRTIIHLYFINRIFEPIADEVINIVTLSTWQYAANTKQTKSQQNKTEKH